MKLPSVLVLTDRHQLPTGRGLVETLTCCVGVGATHVVLRELDLAEPERAGLAAELLAIPGIVVISARTSLPGVAGVHLAAGQTPEPGLVHGRSAHDLSEVRRAVVDGAAYATVSPVGPSASKPGYGPPLSSEELQSLVADAGAMPLYALGGVTPVGVPDLRRAGIRGVAVMGSVMRSTDPAAAVTELFEAIGE